MKITKIEEQKRNKDRVSIYVDDNYLFGVNKEVLYTTGLKVGKEITEEYLNEVVRKEERLKANNYALNLISMGGLKTENEVYKKMVSKEFNEDDINGAINLLKEYKYIDDESYTEYYVKDKVNINGYGINKIKNQLYKKGVSSEIINKCIEEFVDNDTQFELAIEVGRKKMNTIRTEDFSVVYRRVSNFLQGRGFSFDVIKKVMGELKKEFNNTDY